MSDLSPIVFFVYNRPIHTRRVLDSLAANAEAKSSMLYIYCDGPKENSKDDVLKNINDVRAVIREKQWCKTVTIIESEKNKGLAKSIIEGVTAIVNKYSKIIVIEDDVLLSPYFLKFMNDSLEKYKDNNKVLSIGSWNYFCNPELIDDNFFYRFPDSIAWATFDRAWKLFEKDGNEALRKILEKKLEHKFNADLPSPYFTSMLQQQIEGKINSWAIRWTATSIIHDKLSFFPKQTLSKHIGFGSGATHETGEDDYNAHLVLAQTEMTLSNLKVEESKVAIDEWRNFIKSNFIHKKKFGERIKNILRPVLPEFAKKAFRKK